MARVFLSYDREDAGQARIIAAAIETAGHEVWWDPHIRGGAEYSKEIEKALNRAEAVVVLWSRRSVDSPWVRDEAASGRDTGKLIPVRLDAADPPLGFRQFQAINLSRRGRDRHKALQELLSAITPDRAPAGSPSGRASRAPKKLMWAAVAGAAVLVGLMLLFVQPWRQKDLAPSVTVSASDEGTASRALAGDLLVKLGSLQQARANSLLLVEPASTARPDYVFKVARAAGSSDPTANVTLVDREGALLWSRQFVQPDGNEADLRQQLAYSAGQVLQCATEALAPEHPKLDPSTLRLFLSGCADLSGASKDPRAAIQIFRDVTKREPRFAGAWGKLLIAELEAFKSADALDLSLQNDLRADVDEARKINPDLAEIYLVQSWLQKPRPIEGWMRFADEALKKNPAHARILENHAIGLGHFGRIRDAIEDARRAKNIEPLAVGLRQTLIDFLMESGDLAAARREVREAERLWPGASNIIRTKFLLESRYGDPRLALKLLESGQLDYVPSRAQRSFLAARSEGSPASIERAVEEARSTYKEANDLSQLIHTLAMFGRNEQVIDVLRASDPRETPGVIFSFFRSSLSEVRRDRRFMEIAQRYGLVEYWRATGRWPDFCLEPALPYDCKIEAEKLDA